MKGSSRRGGGVGARAWDFGGARLRVAGLDGSFLAGCATGAMPKSSSSASVSDPSERSGVFIG